MTAKVHYCKNEECEYKMAVANTDSPAETSAETTVPAV